HVPRGLSGRQGVLRRDRARRAGQLSRLPAVGFPVDPGYLRAMAVMVRVDAIGAHTGESVELRGWLAARRSSGKIHFLQVRDGSGTIQCVMGQNDVAPEVFARPDHLPQETSLVVTGTVRADARSPLGVELGVTDLQVIHAPADEFPIAPKDHGTGF